MYDLRWVRDNYEKGQNPRVHPNGFIQLDMGDVAGGWHESHQQGHSGAAVRLHVWNPPGFVIPHQETTNEIHDHVFDMRSTLVKGAFTQKLYTFVFGSIWKPTHELYRAIYNKGADSRLESLGVKGVLRLDQTQPLNAHMPSANRTYKQRAFTLHDTEVEEGVCVVTVMEKTKIHEGDATVVCPVDQPPDNSFDRASAAPADYLMAAIEAALA
jgi:hypothetical protein